MGNQVIARSQSANLSRNQVTFQVFYKGAGMVLENRERIRGTKAQNATGVGSARAKAPRGREPEEFSAHGG